MAFYASASIRMVLEPLCFQTVHACMLPWFCPERLLALYLTNLDEFHQNYNVLALEGKDDSLNWIRLLQVVLQFCSKLTQKIKVQGHKQAKYGQKDGGIYDSFTSNSV